MARSVFIVAITVRALVIALVLTMDNGLVTSQHGWSVDLVAPLSIPYKPPQ